MIFPGVFIAADAGARAASEGKAKPRNATDLSPSRVS